MLAGGREREGGRGGTFKDESKCYDAARGWKKTSRTLSLLVPTTLTLDQDWECGVVRWVIG